MCLKVCTHTYVHIHKIKCANRQYMNKHKHFLKKCNVYLNPCMNNTALTVYENSLKTGVKSTCEEK